jgi:hypothetical protein
MRRSDDAIGLRFEDGSFGSDNRAVQLLVGHL